MKRGERRIFKLKYSGLEMKINIDPRQAPLQHAGGDDHLGCSAYCHSVSWVWALGFAGSQSSPSSPEASAQSPAGRRGEGSRGHLVPLASLAGCLRWRSLGNHCSS